jgi:acyl-CoA synthetase (NDP forming)
MRALVCRTAEEAARAATAIGYPVVLKATGPAIPHKSDVGGVRLGLRDAAAVTRAFTDLQMRLGTTMTSALVQEMAADGPEFLVGATNDPTFGPVVAVGAGGTMAELMRDVVFRLAPLSSEAIVGAIDETRACRLLRGFRGELPRDEDALAAIVSAVSALASACPQIAELDLNPVRVYAKGARVLDARIRLARPPVRVSSKLEY